jgi:hypothetical protein
MELYLNSTWTERYANSSYAAEAIAWSENGNHATIYATDITADEAQTKLLGALRELNLVPEATTKVEPTA